jgi:hypothetical protein
MRAADVKTMGGAKSSESDGTSIEESIEQKSVLNDLLNENITEEVQELVDSNYRVLRHANDYEYLGNGNVIKKQKNMLADNLKIFNPEGYKIIVIQDNKLVVKGVLEATKDRYNEDGDIASEDMVDRYTIKIERDIFPRFLIEKYTKKIVVRQSEENVKVDLYCSSYPRQFRPTDALFINEMMNIYGKKTRNLDTVDIDTVEFITDKAYGVDDIILFKFGNMKYEGMNMYEKDFVITYTATPICDAVDLTEKYHMDSLDEKYATNARRENAPETVINFEDLYYEKDTLDTNEASKLLKELNITNFENSAE